MHEVVNTINGAEDLVNQVYPLSMFDVLENLKLLKWNLLI